MKQLRIFLLFVALFGLIAVGTGCGGRTGAATTNAESTATTASGNRTMVELPQTDVAVAFSNGGFHVANSSNETWTNVHLTLDQSYTAILDRVLSRQSVTVPIADFLHDGRSIAPSLIGHGLVLQMTCDLPGNREGTFFTAWH